MPRVDIPITELDPAGTEPPAAVDSDASDDHVVDFDGDQRVWLEVDNTDAADRTVTIVTQIPDVDGLAYPDRAVAVPAGEVRLIPLKHATYAIRTAGDPDFGKAYVNVTHDTVLKLRAYRLPRD